MEILSTVIASVSIHKVKRAGSLFGENLAYSLTNTDPNQTNTYNDFLRMMPTIPIYDENTRVDMAMVMLPSTIRSV